MNRPGQRKFHFNRVRTAARADGKHGLKFGFSVGYWPCIHAPYIQLFFATHIFKLWHGLPSYTHESSTNKTSP